MTEPTVSLRDYFEQRLEDSEKRLDERWRSQEIAVEKATHGLQERLHLLNDLRGNVLSRDEYNARHEALQLAIERNRDELVKLTSESLTIKSHKPYEARIAVLETWRANVMGRAVAFAVIGAVLVAAVSAIIAHLATGG